MADNGERRMLFDTRGRRKNVIRVVYAALAILMGGSLFLTVGPFSLGELFETGGAGEASEVLEDQAERVEGRLAKDPTNEALLLSATRSRISSGNAKTEIDPQTGTVTSYPPEALDDFERALETWSRYLKQVEGKPNPAAAQLVASTFFTLAEQGSTTLNDVEENLATAVRAQRIAARERPNVGSLSTLAIYEYFNGNFAAGDRAAKRAAASAPSGAEAKNIDKQLVEFRKRAQRYVKQSERVAKSERKTGREQLQNPFSLGGAAPPGG